MPVIPPGPIFTLSPEEIARFFVRARRDQDTEHWDVRLDGTLREILERANDFVPSEIGRHPARRSARQAAGGAGAAPDLHRGVRPGLESVVGKRLPSDRGFAGTRLHHRPPQADRSARARRSDAGADLGDRHDPLAGGGAHRRRRIDLRHPAARPTGARATPYTPRDRELLRIFAAYMSSSIQNALDAIRARALARVDDLTGLANSRYFHTRLTEEIARADRDGTELSMLFIDLDRFKGVNDMLRPPGGELDAAEGGAPPGRQRAAGRAGRALRRRRVRRDPAGRRPGARRADRRDAAQGDRRRDLLRPAARQPAHAAAAAAPAHHRLARRSRPTATTWRPGGTQRRRESTLLRLADSAMYRAKAAGRNRVEIADPED